MDGRLVRSVTTREAEWDDEQQAHLLALADYRAQVHEPCGGYLPDTTAKDAEGQYAAGLPVRCHLCTARLARVRAAWENTTHPEALLWPVRRR